MSGFILLVFGLGLLLSAAFLLLTAFVAVAQGHATSRSAGVIALRWFSTFLGLASVTAILFAGKFLGIEGWL